MGCKTSALVDGDRWIEHTFYVSRGYAIRRVFLYGELDGRLYIIYYTDNVGVWYTLIYFQGVEQPSLLICLLPGTLGSYCISESTD